MKLFKSIMAGVLCASLLVTSVMGAEAVTTNKGRETANEIYELIKGMDKEAVSTIAINLATDNKETQLDAYLDAENTNFYFNLKAKAEELPEGKGECTLAYKDDILYLDLVGEKSCYALDLTDSIYSKNTENEEQTADETGAATEDNTEALDQLLDMLNIKSTDKATVNGETTYTVKFNLNPDALEKAYALADEDSFISSGGASIANLLQGLNAPMLTEEGVYAEDLDNADTDEAEDIDYGDAEVFDADFDEDSDEAIDYEEDSDAVVEEYTYALEEDDTQNDIVTELNALDEELADMEFTFTLKAKNNFVTAATLVGKSKVTAIDETDPDAVAVTTEEGFTLSLRLGTATEPISFNFPDFTAYGEPIDYKDMAGTEFLPFMNSLPTAEEDETFEEVDDGAAYAVPYEKPTSPSVYETPDHSTRVWH